MPRHRYSTVAFCIWPAELAAEEAGDEEEGDMGEDEEEDGMGNSCDCVVYNAVYHGIKEQVGGRMSRHNRVCL